MNQYDTPTRELCPLGKIAGLVLILLGSFGAGILVKSHLGSNETNLANSLNSTRNQTMKENSTPQQTLVEQVEEFPHIISLPNYFEAYGKRSNGEHFRYVVDAESGEFLQIKNNNSQITYSRGVKQDDVNEMRISQEATNFLMISKKLRGGYSLTFSGSKNPKPYLNTSVDLDEGYGFWLDKGTSLLKEERQRFKKYFKFESPKLKD